MVYSFHQRKFKLFLVDTNSDCSVLVVDSYFMIKFRTTQVAEYILFLTYKLRSTWDKLLNLRISRGLGKVANENKKK